MATVTYVIIVQDHECDNCCGQSALEFKVCNGLVRSDAHRRQSYLNPHIKMNTSAIFLI